MKSQTIASVGEKLFLFGSLAILFFLLVSGIFRESLIFDENLHVVAGYTFLTSHSFFEEPYNPPLPREIIALPELFDHQLANDPIFFWQRMMVVIITLIFATTVYLFTKRLYGLTSAKAALLFFILEPNILAHGHYAATDLILSFFFFLSIMLFWSWRYTLTNRRIVMLGIIWGLTLSCKVSALPFLIISTVVLYFFSKSSKHEFLSKMYWRKRITSYTLIFISVIIGLWGTYFFTLQPALGGNFDPHRRAVVLGNKLPVIHFFLTHPIPLGAYINSIKQILLYNYSSAYVKSAFLHGNISTTGFHDFFPIAFVLKTEIPLLLGFIICLIYFIKRRRLSETFQLIPITAVMLLSMVSSLNLGIRYILPLYPFIIVFISQISNIPMRSLIKYALLGVFVSWNVVSIWRVYPHYLSFFNELTGSPTYGYTYLIDSNYDWGQGLVDLAAYQRSHPKNHIQLAYFGMVNPQEYGLTYRRIKDISLGDKQKINAIQPGIVVISASCYYYCGYYREKEFKGKPDSIIGGSLLLYNTVK